MNTHIRSGRIAAIRRGIVSAKVAVMIALSPMLAVVDASAQVSYLDHADPLRAFPYREAV